MGTSNSGSGPGDSIPLIPDWALPSGINGGEVSDPADGGTPGVTGGDVAHEVEVAPAGGDEAADGADAASAPDAPVVVNRPPRNWTSAKARLSSLASRGGGRRRIAAAGRAYVQARGGARNASRSATGARSATARLGGFLSDVANRGIGPALDALGLARFTGRDVNTVFAAIVDALAPEGADIEQVSAREAIEQTLAGLFEQYVAPDGSVAALGAMTPDAIRSAIEASVAASIFNRWLGDLERRLEEKAVSAAQAVKLERDVKSYILDTVKLDLQRVDPLTMQWGGAEGQAFVDRIYEDAYSILGGHP